MIQPEPEDLPKDNPKLEIAVLRFLSSGGKGVKQNKGTNAMNTAVNKEINDDGSKLVLAEDHGKPLKHRNISTDTHNGVDVDANSYAHCVNAYLNVKKVNFRTLLALAGNGADVRFQWIRLAKRWSCNANPSKKDLSSVLVLVKFHDPITAFTYDALSVIATKLGTPLMLNTYTTTMYTESWVDMVDISPPNVDVKSLGTKGKETGSNVGKNKERDTDKREREREQE
ncbi:hypothetical protein Tco_0909824 [Tanacetum coccineum]|uniref:Uncharacterized protein n=1 Tax=Tanacetum coccineum TaxID=301880 RepID=A0ABQ5CXF4_9ASTR